MLYWKDKEVCSCFAGVMIRGDIKGKGCLELLEGQPDWSHPLLSKLGV